MTDLPDTDTLKGLLVSTTPGPWKAVLGEDQPWPAYIGLVGYVSMNPLISVVCDHDCEADHWPTNASLIALAPALAARVIEQDAALAAKDARIAELEAKVERLEVISRGIVSLANELSWGKKTRDIAARICAALEDGQ